MKEKIAFLMESEGLTTTRLAEILETQPSAVSHLVSGRNKPSYDLLQKILRRFPRINPDWLLLDSDEAYRAEHSPTALDMSSEDELGSEDINDRLAGVVEGDTRLNDPKRGSLSGEQISGIKSLTSQNRLGKSPIFVIVFYDDGSCENFSMR